MEPLTAKPFNELLVISDDQSWVWNYIKEVLDHASLEYLKLGSHAAIRPSWERFKNAGRIIIHWENNHRLGGAIVEEILDVAPNFDVGDKIIVVTTNPVREDVVYCSELGLRRIIRLRNRDKDIVQAMRELRSHLFSEAATSKAEIAWRRIIRAIDLIPGNAPEEHFKSLNAKLESLLKLEYKETARYLDAKGCVAFKQGNHELAEKFWLKALDLNSNYFRTYNNLIKLYKETDRSHAAFALMRKMQALNPSNISRLVSMGDVHARLGDDMRAEHYYQSALERDHYCSRALNGLAIIKFRSGDLEESRRLLSRSNLAYQIAQELNMQGIEMVKNERFQDALEHYMKAQYVIPQQDKGPMLFYNIGLCYSKWGKNDLAKEFLRIALIKEPTYKKAQRLLETVDQNANPSDAA